MKVLIVSDCKRSRNPYVRTLASALQQKGADVTCSTKEFWNNPLLYDIIHFQWPNALYDRKDKYNVKLKEQLYMIRNNHIPMISTCHNILPHYNANPYVRETFRLVYENCDYIQHLGENSIEKLLFEFPDITAKHVVIPHHIYDEYYQFNVDKEVAKKKLSIPKDAKVVLSIGLFRANEERKIVTDLSVKLGYKDYYWLMPGFYNKRILQKSICYSLKILLFIVRYKIMAMRFHIHTRLTGIPDKLVPYYLAAADVMLIPRLKIMNSGNVFLAMSAGLPIIGPDEGNVGVILNETGNYLYKVDDLSTLPELVVKAINNTNLGHMNQIYANGNLSTNLISAKLYDLYLYMLVTNRQK